MGSHLHPCSGCHRHVQIAESTCPFCGHELSGGFGENRVPNTRKRLKRSAAFAFATAAVLSIHCGGDSDTTEPGDSRNGQQGGSAGSGGIAPAYGAPAGNGGDSGSSGSAGNAGDAGAAGDAGSAGQGQSGDGGGGGVAPAYGAPGVGGSGGDAGSAGEAGSMGGTLYGAPPSDLEDGDFGALRKPANGLCGRGEPRGVGSGRGCPSGLSRGLVFYIQFQ